MLPTLAVASNRISLSPWKLGLSPSLTFKVALIVSS
jgi:hypothetical protein